MSYIRGDYYTFVSASGDGEHINFMFSEGSTSMPLEIFDELVAMRVAEMIEEGKLEAAAERAIQKYSGNVGCSALREHRGLKSWGEMVGEVLKKDKEKREEPTN